MSTPWADRPWSLLSTSPPENRRHAHPDSVYVFVSMALAHNVTLRHLNSIYLQATGVHKPEDIKDFLFYCKTWVDGLHEHHKGEEEKLFPMLDSFTGVSGVMSKCEDQHKVFFGGMEIFSQYVQRTSIKEYNGKNPRELIDTFADALILHLRHEPLELLELGEKYGGTKLKTVWDKFETGLIKEGMSKWDKNVILPLAIGMNDHGYEDGKHANWPPFPFFLPFLIRNHFSRKHSGVWRFCPCWNSKRRELQFVGEDWRHARAFQNKVNKSEITV